MRIQNIAKATITAATALVISAAPAFAAVNSTSVMNTGADANVNSNTTTNSSTTVTNSNTAVVDQNVHAVSNTGGNDANGNISLGGVAGQINTGAANVVTGLGVDVNHNETAVTGAGASATANVLDVVNTGKGADINANATNNSAVAVSNVNTAVVTQTAHEKANTGKNDANSNIGGGSIGTGPANVTTGMTVAANHNATGVGAGMGALTNGAALLNETSVINSGADASVNSNATSNTAAVVTNYNSLWSYQDIYAKSNTGKNDANSNIGGGHVGTGPATVGTTAAVNANHNESIVSGLGGGAGVNLADIVNTGYNLNSNTNVTENTTEVVANANDLWGYQSVWEISQSGYNDTDYNIGGGVVGTAGAGVGTGLAVGGNHNSTAIGWLLPFWSWFGM